MPPFLKPTDSRWRVQQTPANPINLPALRATISHKTMVLLISKHLRGYLRGNTPVFVCVNRPVSARAPRAGFGASSITRSGQRGRRPMHPRGLRSPTLKRYPYLSGCPAWLLCLNPFHSNGFHRAANRFRALLNSPRPPLRHTLLPTLVGHPGKASSSQLNLVKPS
jgi:hypothetical protein